MGAALHLVSETDRFRRESEVLRLLATNSVTATAKALGLTRGQVSGIAFRARGGARKPDPGRWKRRQALVAPRTVRIGNCDMPFRPMTDREKAQMFGAMATVEDGRWWVKVPNVLPEYRSQGRAIRTAVHLEEVACRDEAEARFLSHYAWGFE